MLTIVLLAPSGSLWDEFPVPATCCVAALRTHVDESPSGLSRDDWTQIRIAVKESAYHASLVAQRAQASALAAANWQQAYRTTFRPEGIEIVPLPLRGPSWRLAVSVTSYGYEGDVRPAEPAEPQAAKERVEYRRGPVTEWYVNRPGGLEQGFYLEEPQPRRAVPLVVAMAVQGDLDVSVSGDSISFSRLGETLVRYAGLKAWDSEGRPLPSRLEAVDREVRLVVEAETARFPVTVDPTFVNEAQLFGQGDPIDQSGDLFGYAVSVSGDTVLIGAPRDDTAAGADAGSAYVFVRSGTAWSLQQKLTASDGAAGDNFGLSVSVSGDTVVIGSYHHDAGGFNAGSAYVFVRSGISWAEQQKLRAADAAGDDEFGVSVSISGDTVVIGAHQRGFKAGSAYVFMRSGTTWTQQQKLLASDGATGDFFGWSVSVSGDTAVVGAWGHDLTPAMDAGSAYVFVRSGTTWTEQQKLVASDGAAGDYFGISVSVSEDTVAVGARGDDTSGGAGAGSAYVFVRLGTTWSEHQNLTASDGAFDDSFGRSVSVSGNTIVVGAASDTPAGVNAGSTYVFVRSGTTWSEQQKLTASDGAPDDFFGGSVSVSDDTVVVGALVDDTPGGVDAGSAHVYAVRDVIFKNGFESVPGNNPPTVSISGGGSCHPSPSRPCTVEFVADAHDTDGDAMTLTWSACASGGNTVPRASCARPRLTRRGWTRRTDAAGLRVPLRPPKARTFRHA